MGQNVSVSLCGADTNFDTILSVYEKTGEGTSLKLTLLACNDDSCGVQSAIPSVALKKNHTIVFVSSDPFIVLLALLYRSPEQQSLIADMHTTRFI